MTWLDGLVVGIYFIIVLSIAVYYSRRAGSGTQQFFLSNRDLPWWIAGTAMVATTFAADTPLAVTELVASKGIAGNWLWWNMAIGSMLTVFFFAKLWRRAEILTDVEFTEIRYSGRVAAALRGIRALYLGLFMNVIILAWVNKAMQKIFYVLFPQWNDFYLVCACMFVIAIYASASGLLGTARIDSVQFVIAMVGCIVLAMIVINLPQVGGITGLKAQLPEWVRQFTPRIGEIPAGTKVVGGVMALSAGAFFAHIGLQWWASWYPGADPGGGGYVAQRMMSAKDEKQSLFATLWFTIAHYTLRPWPWILVALSALVLLPRATDLNELKNQDPAIFAQVENAYQHKQEMIQQGTLPQDEKFLQTLEIYENTIDPGVMYPKLMVRYLPAGLLGLLIAVFLAAYMSTISSQLNWGTSYIINDFYRRFIRAEAPEAHYIMISRIAILILSIISLLVTKYVLATISGAWEFIINASAGIGAVLILRWYWWRMNAWSEISAMLAPLIIYPISIYVFHLEPPLTLYPTVFGTTIAWLAVTFLTKPADQELLKRFYAKVHPGGIGWRKFRKLMPEIVPDSGYGRLFICWIAGVVLIYSALYGSGMAIMQEYGPALIACGLAFASALTIYWMKPWQSMSA